MAETKYEAANRSHWDEVTPVHVRAYGNHFVGVDEFLTGHTTLDPIELRDLGDVRGKSLLHLQCHFGLDSLSWVREGAHVTGIDFSQASINEAIRLRDRAGLEADFVCCNVYDLPAHLEGSFDIVYTSRGVLEWLKDLKAWATIVRRYLKPGGLFYLMELHPVVMALEKGEAGGIEFRNPYFSMNTPILDPAGYPDYADPSYKSVNETHVWPWSLGEIVNAVIGAGMSVESLVEYDKLFFPGFDGMVQAEPGWWRIPGLEGKLPMTFTLMARA